jgi:hypothetical protein
MEFLNEDDTDLDRIVTKKEKDDAAKVVKKMRNLVKGELSAAKSGKGLQYFSYIFTEVT